jgi:hypothetical protein
MGCDLTGVTRLRPVVVEQIRNQQTGYSPLVQAVHMDTVPEMGQCIWSAWKTLFPAACCWAGWVLSQTMNLPLRWLKYRGFFGVAGLNWVKHVTGRRRSYTSVWIVEFAK